MLEATKVAHTLDFPPVASRHPTQLSAIHSELRGILASLTLLLCICQTKGAAEGGVTVLIDAGKCPGFFSFLDKTSSFPHQK
jgi:hypothetical protein